MTGIDDHSRYCVIARAVRRATARPACRAFIEAMTVYGVPEEVLTDNGITARRTRLRSPATTGKTGRLHQSRQDELPDVPGPFASLAVLQAALDAWRQEYNTGRPHQSPGMAFPASRFAPAHIAAAAAGADPASRGQRAAG